MAKPRKNKDRGDWTPLRCCSVALSPRRSGFRYVRRSRWSYGFGCTDSRSSLRTTMPVNTTDPVAYRIEPLIIPEACKVPPAVIDHHKGRKRMHLEVQKNIATVASTLKSSIMNPLNLVSSLASGASNFFSKRRQDSLNKDQKGVNVTSPTEERLQKPRASLGPAAPIPAGSSSGDEVPKIRKFGSLNGGDRIDYVLQEAPLESINQYLFVLHSHAVYWDSEDVLLCMLKSIIEVEKDNITLSEETDEEEEHQYV